MHLFIQIGLLLLAVLVFGGTVNLQWAWLPVVWLCEIVFVCGLALITSTLNVYIRDTRYIVESVNTVLFWLVPIFYSFDIIPQKYSDVYVLNPIAAIVLCLRNILLAGVAPATSTFQKLAAVSVLTLAVGLIVFQWGKSAFYEHI
jgi:ABC-type polysaccharide/polyol phosphate export permease